jgi:hypothetical protein
MKELLRKNTKDGELDISSILIDMEKKINKKFGAYDDILKSINDGSTKIRGEILNIFRKFDEIKLIRNNQMNAAEFFGTDNPNNISSNNNDNLFDEYIQQDNNENESKDQSSRNTLDPLNSNRNIEGINSAKNNKPIDYNKLLKDMMKKIQELEKNYTNISSNLNPEIIKSELSRLNEIVENRLGDNEAVQIKESLSKIFLFR